LFPREVAIETKEEKNDSCELDGSKQKHMIDARLT